MSPAVIGLVILVICVLLFLTEKIPNAATGCLGCLLMVLFGACSFEEAFSGFSNSIVLLMVGAMVVGIAMFETGAAQIIGRKVILWSRGSERLFVLVGSVVAGVLAMFLANTAVLAAFLPIIDSVCRTSPTMGRKNLSLPIACAVMYGGACTLIGCTPQLTANGIMGNMVGVQLGMWDMTRPGLCMLALFLLYTQLVGYRRGKKIWGDRPETDMGLDEEKVRSVLEKAFDKKKLAAMFGILLLMVLFYAVGWISTAMTAMCAAMLCILTGCCSVKKVVRELDWECVIFLATCLGLANGLTASGAGELIGAAVSRLLGGVASPMVIFASMVLLALLISQIITNSTAVIIVLPIALSLCTTYGFNYIPFCLGVTFAGSFACSTPLAAAQITMTQVAGYKFTDYFRYTWQMAILSFVGILIFVPLFYPLVG